MVIEGSNGSVELAGNCLIIRRKGVANILTQGFQGEKTIPIASITAIQFRPASSSMAGFIQFTIIGGREYRGGMMEATKDENAVFFDKNQEANFCTLRDIINQSISKGIIPEAARNIGVSLSDELEKLSSLQERGMLSDIEFEIAKAKLLQPSSLEGMFKTAHVAIEQDGHLLPSGGRRNDDQLEKKSGCLRAAIITLIILVLLSFIGLMTEQGP